MMNIKKNSEISIVTLDPYEYKGFRYHNSGVDAFNLSKAANKRDFFISYIEYKYLITSTFNIPRTVDDDDLENTISIKIYEELSLDPSLDYKIIFFETDTQSEERIFNVFVASNDQIYKIFKNVARRVPYVDYIVPEPLLYTAIYEKGLLASTDVDCFVTIRKDEAFLSVYSRGEYLTSRSVRYTLSYLKDKFSEQSGERMSEDKFLEILSTRGLVDKDKDGFNYDLNTVFEDCIFYINDTINIINRIYNVNVRNLYIDCDYKIENFINFISTKLGMSTERVNTNIAINNKSFVIEERHNIMALYARFFAKDAFNAYFNFTNMLRPKPFAKRKSGQFLLTCAAAFVLSMLYPAYNYIAGLVLEKDTLRLSDEYSVLNAQEMQIKETLAKISKEQESVRGLTQKENEKLNFRKNLLAEIENKKDNYAMKGLNLFKITDILNLNAVSITNVVNNDRNLTITAISDNEKRITQLIKDISKDEKYLVNTKKIRSDDVKHEYESNISIEIRQ